MMKLSSGPARRHRSQCPFPNASRDRPVSGTQRDCAHYQDALGRLAVAIQQVSEAQVAEKGDHEAVARAKRQVGGAQQEPGDHAKMRREDELALREQQLQETRRTEGEKKSQVEQRRKPMVSEVGLPREPSTTPSFVLAREGAPGAVSTAPVTALGALGRAGGKQAAKGSVNVSGDGGEGWGRQTCLPPTAQEHACAPG